MQGSAKTEKINLSLAKINIGMFYLSGRIDSYFSIPQNAEAEFSDYRGKFSTGIEGGYRYYPLKLTNSYGSPFIGLGLAFPNYHFASKHGKGVKKFGVSVPLSAGYGFLWGRGQVDIGVRYAFGQKGEYYFAPDTKRAFDAEGQEFFINYKHLTNYQTTAQQESSKDFSDYYKGLHLYATIAPSVSWFTQGRDKGNPDLALDSSGYGNFNMDYSLGVLTHLGQKNRRLMAQFSYRPIDIDLQAYGKSVNYKNDSLGVEILYNPIIMFGLAPFVGVGRFLTKWNIPIVEVRHIMMKKIILAGFWVGIFCVKRIAVFMFGF